MTLTELLQTPEYSSLSDTDAHALLHQKRHASTVDVWVDYMEVTAAVGQAVTENLIESVDAAAATSALVREAREFLRSDRGLNVGHATTRGLLDSFAANQLLPLTAEDAAAIKAIAEITVSDVEKHQLGTVKPGHIQEARR